MVVLTWCRLRKWNEFQKPQTKTLTPIPLFCWWPENCRIQSFGAISKNPICVPFSLYLVPLPLTRPNNPRKNCENGSLAGFFWCQFILKKLPNESHQMMLWNEDFAMSTLSSMRVLGGDFVCLFGRLFFFNATETSITFHQTWGGANMSRDMSKHKWVWPNLFSEFHLCAKGL